MSEPIGRRRATPKTTARNLKSGPAGRRLGQLDLLRSLSSVWIIVSHSYFFALAWLSFEPTTIRSVYGSLLEQLLPGATFAVDNFFLLSGLLAHHKSAQADDALGGAPTAARRRPHETLELERRRHPRPGGRQPAAEVGNEEHDLHHHHHHHHQQQQQQQLRRSRPPLSSLIGRILLRYLRLAPAMLGLIAGSLLVLPRLCSALQDDCTNWPKASAMFVDWCRPKWHLNLLMVHNWVHTQTMCMSHSWFVAVDFQLFALFVCVSWLVGRPNVSRLWGIALAMLACQTLNAVIVYTHDLPAMPLIRPNADADARNASSSSPALVQAKEDDFYRLVYIKPHHWASSYLIGIGLSANFGRLRRITGRWSGQRRRLVGSANLLLLGTLLLSSWPYRRSGRPMGRLYASVHIFFARPFWSMNVAALLVLGSAAKFNMLLAKLFACLSRLTYSAYLLHPILMAAFYGTRNETFNFSHYLMLYFTLGHLVVAHLFAVIVYLLIELPIRRTLRATARTPPQRSSPSLADDRRTMRPSGRLWPTAI
jgi:peptidoglycan/LPS O-acetylase OafA/YrhL